ncbi:MBL fold metallo-hydrolase [Pelotomaculum propionicicum]|uniref:Ribonuclease n=1 Tax=Pelotomaculum propionicicum TaxID=258475 RepID=A0A4Y7RXK6_9FIRM|nr:MBL fold metallo-hydrolase [Pelotomaculum propionicicum]TEB13476.1 Ribonuclease [Pelotomaculum propionicicum]
MDIFCGGGSAEQGRTAYLISEGTHSILLDFGVQRVFAGTYAGRYPQMELEMLSRVEGVVLSHAHEDHSAALPLLVKQGLKVPVYCHRLTAALTPMYCASWRGAVENANFCPPYSKEDVNSLFFSPQEFGKVFTIGSFDVEMGPSGHMPGSAWILVTGKSHKLLYTGDICRENRLLIPPQLPADISAIIINSAYGAQSMRQAKQEEELLLALEHCMRNGGAALLPVPRIGRGQEMVSCLLQISLSGVPVYIDKGLTDALKYYQDYHEGLSAEGKSFLQGLDMSKFNILPAGFEPAKISKPAIIVMPDAMLSAGPSEKWFRLLAEDERNSIILTGSQAAGTIGARLLSGERIFLPENSGEPFIIGASVKKITWKAHPDWEDLQYLLAPFAGRTEVILGHCNVENSGKLAAELKKIGISSRIMPTGSTIHLPG